MPTVRKIVRPVVAAALLQCQQTGAHAKFSPQGSFQRSSSGPQKRTDEIRRYAQMIRYLLRGETMKIVETPYPPARSWIVVCVPRSVADDFRGSASDDSPHLCRSTCMAMSIYSSLCVKRPFYGSVWTGSPIASQKV